MKVLKLNISFKFFVEILFCFGPYIFYDITEIYTLTYALFKISRYDRLFEMEAKINDYIEYYSQSKTVFE